MYQYEGMQNGKPFYRRLESWMIPPPTTTSSGSSAGNIRHKRFIGRVSSETTTARYPGGQYPSSSGYGNGGNSYSSSSSSSSSSSYSSSSSSGGGSAGGWSSPSSSLNHDHGHGHAHQGHSSHGASAAATPTRPPGAKPEKIFFLYWDPKPKSWSIGEKMDGKDVRFRTKKNSVSKCPGDPNALKTWEYSGTLSWKSEPAMKAACGLKR